MLELAAFSTRKVTTGNWPAPRLLAEMIWKAGCAPSTAVPVFQRAASTSAGMACCDRTLASVWQLVQSEVTVTANDLCAVPAAASVPNPVFSWQPVQAATPGMLAPKMPWLPWWQVSQLRTSCG